MARLILMLRRTLWVTHQPVLLLFLGAGAWIVDELARRALQPGDATLAALRGGLIVLAALVQLALSAPLHVLEDAQMSPQRERVLRGGRSDLGLRALALWIGCWPSALVVCLVTRGLPREPLALLAGLLALACLGLALGCVLRGGVLRGVLLVLGLVSLLRGLFAVDPSLAWVEILLPPLPAEEPSLLAPLAWATGALLLGSAALHARVAASR